MSRGLNPLWGKGFRGSSRLTAARRPLPSLGIAALLLQNVSAHRSTAKLYTGSGSGIGRFCVCVCFFLRYLVWIFFFINFFVFRRGQGALTIDIGLEELTVALPVPNSNTR